MPDHLSLVLVYVLQEELSIPNAYQHHAAVTLNSHVKFAIREHAKTFVSVATEDPPVI